MATPQDPYGLMPQAQFEQYLGAIAAGEPHGAHKQSADLFPSTQARDHFLFTAVRVILAAGAADQEEAPDAEA